MSEQVPAGIGHNTPPESTPRREWEKRYFYMPMEEAEQVVAFLDLLKRMMPEGAVEAREMIDGRIQFMQRKMK